MMTGTSGAPTAAAATVSAPSAANTRPPRESAPARSFGRASAGYATTETKLGAQNAAFATRLPAAYRPAVVCGQVVPRQDEVEIADHQHAEDRARVTREDRTDHDRMNP